MPRLLAMALKRVWCSPFLLTTESDSYSERERESESDILRERDRERERESESDILRERERERENKLPTERD